MTTIEFDLYSTRACLYLITVKEINTSVKHTLRRVRLCVCEYFTLGRISEVMVKRQLG